MCVITIGHLRVSGTGSPLVVAEIGANHDGSPQKAAAMVHAIAQTGAKAVKFQYYTAAELVADEERLFQYGPPGRCMIEPIGAMFNRLSLPLEALQDLFALARELGLEPFATPFSERGAEELLSIGTPCFKIAASDVTHLPMLAHIGSLGRPVILSLGKCTLAEVDMAVECLFRSGCKELALLHCVATYPSPLEEMNLRVIPALQAAYPECVIGFSDHSQGNLAAIAAVALGARILEKHVTLCHEDPGPDHWFSLDMDQLREYVSAVSGTYIALGHPRKRILPSEQKGRQNATRSLVAARDIKAGQQIAREDLRVLRPGNGISPYLLDAVVGMVPCQDIKRNSVLTWSMFHPSAAYGRNQTAAQSPWPNQIPNANMRAKRAHNPTEDSKDG